MTPRSKKIISTVAAFLAALIILQTLFFKFTAAPESVYIFSRLGMEPWGRIGTGIVELLASFLLIIPSQRWLGAFIGMCVMGGAIVAHLTSLGIEVMDDGGYLFLLALSVFLACLVCLYLDASKIKAVYARGRHSR